MFHLLKKIQKKPESTRRRIALGTAAALTLIVVVFWASTLGSRASLTVNEEPDAILSPFASLKRSFSRLSNNLAGTYTFNSTDDNSAPEEPENSLFSDREQDNKDEEIGATTTATTTETE